MSNLSIPVSTALLLILSTPLYSHAAPAEAVSTPNSSTVSPGAEPSVLEHFRTYTGKRTPDDLFRLFYVPGATDVAKQKPEIALSDGRKLVELTVKITVTDNAAPNFACIEARLISVKQVQPGVWQLELLPDQGSWKSAVVIQQGGSMRNVPLVVAPPLSSDSDLSLPGFATYLKNSDADIQQRVDLNNDGKSDYQDDYILAANVLAARNADPHDPATRNKRARELTPVRPKP